MISAEDEDSLCAVGFMFDASHAREESDFVISNSPLHFVRLRYIDEEPGHVQSGQHLWPAAADLAKYCEAYILYCHKPHALM